LLRLLLLLLLLLRLLRLRRRSVGRRAARLNRKIPEKRHADSRDREIARSLRSIRARLFEEEPRLREIRLR
jgi:hypothetical protein